MKFRISLIAISILFFASNLLSAEEGYYRFPSIHNNTIVFTAEGDLWKVPVTGGDAQRLTTHLGLEINADISPDGKLIAFNGQYEGPTEIYVIPINGGIPRRITYEGESLGGYNPRVYGWTGDGRIIYSTRKYSTLPNMQLVTINPETLEYEVIPLHQANEGVFNVTGETLFFTRLPFQGSHTRRYKGGTAENIWKYTKDDKEAIPLTTDYTGTTRQPMWYNERIYFSTDMDGTHNIWSMDMDGKDRKQHTYSSGWDINTPDISGTDIVYQKGADLYLYQIGSGKESKININLVSDFDQKRVRWMEHPASSITDVDISPDGKKIVITARGRVFVTPVEGGRWIEITRKSGVRYKNTEFVTNDKIAFLSDETGEMEFWTGAVDGLNPIKQLSNGNNITIQNSIVSPDGKWIAFTDKNEELTLLSIESKVRKKIATAMMFGFNSISFSPDSKWLTYAMPGSNQASQIHLHNISSGSNYPITTYRLDSYSPTWSPDGKWLYFLSDRAFNTMVYSPWGPRQPEPFYNNTTKLYALGLFDGERFPFLPNDELIPEKKEADDEKNEEPNKRKKKKKETEEKNVPEISVNGLMGRLYEVPIEGRNFNQLQISEEYIYWTEREISNQSSRKLYALKISGKKDNKPTLVTEELSYFQLSDDQKKMLIGKKSAIYVIDASGSKADLSKAEVSLKDWKFQIDPVEDWKQMMVDAWRLERDYFWDPGLHGVDWNGMLEKHMPLVSRLTDRYELDDLIAHMVAELSTLHTFVYGGDKREAPQDIPISSLGALLEKDVEKGGYIINYIYQSDPDYPELLSPLLKPQLEIKEGDIITAVNGIHVFDEDHISKLMLSKVGQQVRLSLKHTDGKSFDQIVTPISSSDESNLRYSDWEYTRRKITEKESSNEFGYLHLRAMGSGNYDEFQRNFYPVFNRRGLILDVRHNRGGNIDSWILEKLMRKIWFYWQPRKGDPFWNMQYAFRGHMVILCNERTASDGEAVTEGFRRLGLGKVIGTRTWGGEVWLTSSNRLVDNGIATAAEWGVYDENGIWLIEGHGVEPDVVVDNLPHETYNGKDAQLEAAIQHLKQLIKEDPKDIPPPPPYPNKQFDYKK